MKIVRSLSTFQHLNGAVVTIGNFDGLHLGHQALIERLTQKAAELKLPSVLITFEPMPSEYFNAVHAPARLMCFREKLEAFRAYPLDYIVCLSFNEKLSQMSASSFIKNILVEPFHLKHIIVGADFHFGFRREGNVDLLADQGVLHGFSTEIFMPQLMMDERISSTRIRDALWKGDFHEASRYLGRPYTISGRVIYGDQRGRSLLQTPTANLLLKRKISPLSGVFAVNVFGIDHKPFPGVANIGVRPTLDGSKRLLEVHLFDFDQSLYGKYITVEFIKKIRDEKKFESLEALRAQIQADILACRQVL